MRGRITSSCGEDWQRMAPRGAGRFCESCERVVVDLRDATEQQARALAAQGPICGRVRVNPRGDVVFRSPPLVQVRRAAKGLALAAMLGACESPRSEGEHASTAPIEAPAAAPDPGPPMIPLEQMPQPAPTPQPPPASAPEPIDAGIDAQAAEDGEEQPTRRLRHPHARRRPHVDMEDMGLVDLGM